MKSLKQTLVAIALVLLTATSVYQIDSVKSRTDIAFKNFSAYFSDSYDVETRTGTSVGKRLELWRSSQYIIKTHPYVGVGNGNYPVVIKKYIEQGLVSPYVSRMGHAHNTFFEALISKGVVGLILLLIIIYFPVYIAWKNRKQIPLSFNTTSTFAAIITLMSIGESMLINKNNGVSYLLVFSAVLFSSLIREINTTKK